MEGAPTLNSTTGYPYSFTELPTAVSVDIWTRVKEVVTPLGRYPVVDLAAWHWAVSTLHELATLNRNNPTGRAVSVPRRGVPTALGECLAVRSALRMLCQLL